ncbi:hypothetical protein M422DRAFT_256213 [Sphaerobolus stellatus SS14]|uniref:Uncharacterized protein n=1 Tax=Sphaerobolus stellatus (strain SS14) TaxID=990650 RepID=A0A0C9VR46_SPHS4|nr:hypothetical protein M422DRAFT_256213 [Sphaerobolus stellatus SS14]
MRSQPNDDIDSPRVHATTVTRMFPTGYYAVSTDVQENVQIWDIAGTDPILKLEKKSIGGKEQSRMGWRKQAHEEGRDKYYGAVIHLDTGSSAEEITGHSKALNSVAIRQ